MDPIRYSYHGITFNKQDITGKKKLQRAQLAPPVRRVQRKKLEINLMDNSFNFARPF